METLAEMQLQNKTKKSADFVFFLLVMILVIFGVIMVFSASYYTSISETGNPYGYLKSDLMWAALGTAGMLFMATVDYHIFRKLAPAMLVVSIFLLVLLLVPGVGKETNGAVRWIRLGSITIMPGELAKFFGILFTAAFLSKDPKRARSFKKGVAPVLGLCFLYFFLIYLQPNLSTAVTICMILLGMLTIAGMQWRTVISLIAIGVVGILGVLQLKGGFQLTRVLTFLHPFEDVQGAGWQVAQSLYALGTGGLTGQGLGKSIQKTLYLPEPQNDFIFAIIGEELGFLGCVILILVYVLLIWRCVHIAINAPDMLGMLIAAGVTIMISLQVIMNIAIATSSMPATGVSLPFISYGGNALLIFMALSGIMLNISRHEAV